MEIAINQIDSFLIPNLQKNESTWQDKIYELLLFMEKMSKE